MCTFHTILQQFTVHQEVSCYPMGTVSWPTTQPLFPKLWTSAGPSTVSGFLPTRGQQRWQLSHLWGPQW